MARPVPSGGLSISRVGVVWGYNLAWMVIQDIAKLGLYHQLTARRTGTTLLETRMRAALNEFGDLHRPAGSKSVAAGA